MDENKGRFRVVMLPWLAYSHISQFLGFAKRLTNHNFYIYMCCSQINLQYMEKNLIGQKYSEFIQLVEFNLPSSSEIPLHYQTTKDLPPHLKKTLGDDYDKSGPDFANIILKNIKPDLVIYDCYQWWAVEAASSFNIPCIPFLCGCVALHSLFAHFSIKQAHEPYPFPEICLKDGHKNGDNYSDDDHNDSNSQRFSKSITMSNGVILVKSTMELENKYIDYMSQSLGKKVLPVGPLVQESSQQDVDQHVEIISWLDKKEASSVVYVSFGSEYFLSCNEIQDIAYGLELSQVSFIWIIRLPDANSNLEQLLPNGFIQRVGEKGLIIEKWAPQAKILSHPSTGGFISHCGWGSTMESVCYGVPIIAMPMQFDQPYNARLMETVGAGIEVGRDEEGRLKREEMAEVVRKVVVEDSGATIRKKAKELGATMKRYTETDLVEDIVIKNLVKLCEMN